MSIETIEFECRSRVWYRRSTDEWVLEIEGEINDTNFVCRHTQPASTPPEDVAGLPALYGALQSILDRMPRGPALEGFPGAQEIEAARKLIGE